MMRGEERGGETREDEERGAQMSGDEERQGETTGDVDRRGERRDGAVCSCIHKIHRIPPQTSCLKKKTTLTDWICVQT